MTNATPLDFKKVEALRRHMLLTTSNMAELFKVSRMTYYGWVRGNKIRKNNDKKVRGVLKLLLAVMTEGYPQPDVIAMEQKYRFKRLLELLDNL
tara:strand:+ start:58 stop:339 length:282 start_codon:yes stop_codon:yes gene_type:complete